jgi:very-short-patch-repair endonuclease
MQPQSTADIGTPLAPLPPFTIVRKGTHPKKLLFAQKMRKRPTPAEACLWDAIHLGCAGYKFRRQAIIRGWIPDFYCPAAGLIVEVDGGVHKTREKRDAFRTATLRKLGLHVIRFTNEEVLEDVEAVCQRIGNILRAGGLKPPTYTPKPGGHVERKREWARLVKQAEEERWPDDSPFGRPDW